MAKNKERISLIRKSHEMKRRAAKHGNQAEKVDYAAIIRRDGMRCHICNKRVTSKTLSFDHLIPLSKGGSHTIENIAVAHLKCNVSRGAGRIPAQLLLVVK